jgi:chaperone modulatory protein CbpM
MTVSDEHALTASIFDDSVQLTLQELSRMCAVDERHIVEFVEEGVLTTVSVGPRWHFNGGAVRRARLAMRLQRDLEINMAGVALALDLMEELEQLRRELRMRHR